MDVPARQQHESPDPSISWARRLQAASMELLLGFGALVVGFAIAGVGQAIVSRGVGEPELLSGGALNFMAGPVIMAVAAWGYSKLSAIHDRSTGQPPVELRPRTGMIRTLALVAGGFVATLVGSAGLDWLMELLGFPVAEQALIVEIVEQARETGAYGKLIALCVGGVLLAPVAEELLFRVLFFARLRRRSGPVLAYLLSAGAFATIHGNIQGFVVYSWLGLVLAFVLDRSGRPSVPILVHLLNNAYALALLILGPGSAAP